ncbi:MAG: HAMP domain-containing sensor histidine kinase [Candidatus Thermoplasmatota archaeon]
MTIQHYEQILDATLRNVDLPTLFPEVLARVRSLLEADEVTVYLLDETTHGLYATASIGMEQAVEAGILLAVPIVIDDLPVGVLTVGCISGRPFEPSEIRLLEVVAARIGFAVERTRILRQVQIERGRAERASRFKTTLMHMATHDIKTPLTTIKLQLALLTSAATAGELDKTITVVNRSLTRLEVILDDFLDIARIEAGRFTLALAPVDLRVVAEEVVRMFAPHAALKKLELRLDGESVRLEADERRVTQVLVNLVSNAIRYTQRGSIVIRVDRKEDSAHVVLEAAELIVTDTGKGMTPDQIARLFEPFGQVHEGPQEGTGLGLHLSKVIVDAHGGTIRVESPGEGQGTSVTIELPLRPAPARTGLGRDAAPASGLP